MVDFPNYDDEGNEDLFRAFEIDWKNANAKKWGRRSYKKYPMMIYLAHWLKKKYGIDFYKSVDGDRSNFKKIKSLKSWKRWYRRKQSK